MASHLDRKAAITEVELNERQRQRLRECFGPYVRMCVIIELIKDTPELRAELLEIK